MLATGITMFGRKICLVCDGKCQKAWGINTRPKEQLSDDPDDYVFLSDSELFIAPQDPGTYEGSHGKPVDKVHNKWCARECERHQLVEPGEEFNLTDWNKRRYNIPATEQRIKAEGEVECKNCGHEKHWHTYDKDMEAIYCSHPYYCDSCCCGDFVPKEQNNEPK